MIFTLIIMILFGISKIYFITKKYNLEDTNKNKNIIISFLNN